ncbi:hypothetical protein [Williamsia maris]|uniref:Uncharacterized protein n=1 Tax=Williamsia maris TaxID=72806 RepID=A0ABT1HJF2_9NOCA|nr:hypothetical protein [Williamsia maris]MCP2178058.1 hypothetical protein [Williamsia maris]
MTEWVVLMVLVRRVAVTAGACAVIGAGAVVGAPLASAFTVAPAPGGATVVTTQSEARAIHNANLKPVIDAVLPGFRGIRTKESVGTLVNRYSGIAANTPGGKFETSVKGLPNRTTIYVGVLTPR